MFHQMVHPPKQLLFSVEEAFPPQNYRLGTGEQHVNFSLLHSAKLHSACYEPWPLFEAHWILNFNPS